jgi:histidinol-phosphate aminotransferase
MAVNECPFGPFPAAREAVAAELARLHRYPGRDDDLIARLAAIHGIEPDRVALGNGADAIIGYLTQALAGPGDEVLMGWPSFATYRIDAGTAGATAVTVPLDADGAFDLPAMAERIGPATRLVWVCTPNNPMGAAVSRDALATFLDAVPEDVVVVVDEAYFEYASGPDHADAIAEHVLTRPNVGALRTFSKMYGLAALRIGWFAGPPVLAARLREIRHFSDVTDLAVVAALASLDAPGEVARRRAGNDEQRARLEAGFDALGLERKPSQTNFVTADVGDAVAVAARLEDRGILVRALDGVGTPELLRVSVGAPEEVERFLAELPGALGLVGVR